MNTHTLSMLKKAGAKVTNNETGSHIDISNLNAEKLIELVVQDCANLADNGYGSDNFGNGICGSQLLDHYQIPAKKNKKR